MVAIKSPAAAAASNSVAGKYGNLARPSVFDQTA